MGEVMHVGEDIRHVCESEGTWAGRRGQACVNQDMRARARECAQGQEQGRGHVREGEGGDIRVRAGACGRVHRKPRQNKTH